MLWVRFFAGAAGGVTIADCSQSIKPNFAEPRKILRASIASRKFVDTIRCYSGRLRGCTSKTLRKNLY